MGTTSIKQEILNEVDRLPLHFQKRVLDFARSLKSTFHEGIPGKELLRFVGSMTPEEGELINRVIEEACERVDKSEW